MGVRVQHHSAVERWPKMTITFPSMFLFCGCRSFYANFNSRKCLLTWKRHIRVFGVATRHNMHLNLNASTLIQRWMHDKFQESCLSVRT
jgi:hypothetical protein